MVLAGDASGDSGGPSASLQAFRAANGSRLWSWTPIPSPGQPGYKTWDNSGKTGAGSSLYGGGSYWQSPIVDPAHNLVIVGSGNPEPWNTRGAGMNLYTDSIAALDLYTGQMKWYFQNVHHDLWDSDFPNNGVLFTGTWKGVKHFAVAYVNKVGMTFVLDRDHRQAADPGQGDPRSAVEVPWGQQPPRTDNVPATENGRLWQPDSRP